MRWLVAALVVAVLGLGVAQAGGLTVLAGVGGTGSGNIYAPPLKVTKLQFFPDEADVTRLDFVKVTMDRDTAVGFDTTPGTTEHFDLYVQLKDAGENGLGTPKVVHDFGNGVDGAPKSVGVAFFDDNVGIADIASVAFTICGRHESGDGDFQCRVPP